MGCLSIGLCEIGVSRLMVVVSGEAESAGEVDFELVEGLVPAGGSGAEVAAAFVADVSGGETQRA